MIERDNNDNKQPVYFKILKALFFVLCAITISCLVGTIVNFGKSETVNTGVTFFSIFMFGLMFSVLLFIKAFEPEISKLRLKNERYIQKQTETIQKDIKSRDADIRYRATKKRVQAVVEGFHVEKCPFCGDKVSGDEEYCDKCGEKLYKRCSHCNAVYAGDSKFCKKCGKEL